MTQEDRREKNIVIIGGGIIGVTTAYFLTRHPFFSPTHHRITVIEAVSIAAGASGKAGGLLALWASPACIVPLSFRLHKELADEHNGKARWGYRAVTAGNVNCKVSPKTESSTDGVDKDAEAVAERDAVPTVKKSPKPKLPKTGKGLPSDLNWLDQDNVLSYVEEGDATQTAQVHPLLFTRAIAELAVEAGVNITYGSVTAIHSSEGLKGSAHSIIYKDRDTGEETSMESTDVIVTAGPWTGNLLPEAPVESARAHSLVIKKDVTPYAVFTDIELPKEEGKGKRSVTPEMYARPDGTIYACGEPDTQIPLPCLASAVEIDDFRCDEIHTYVSLIAPSIAGSPVLTKQACYMPLITGDRGPMVGKTRRKGVYVAAGHSCWGIQNSCATGKIMSEILFEGCAKSADVKDLDPGRFCAIKKGKNRV